MNLMEHEELADDHSERAFAWRIVPNTKLPRGIASFPKSSFEVCYMSIRQKQHYSFSCFQNRWRDLGARQRAYAGF
jgi:hypothetical protein